MEAIITLKGKNGQIELYNDKVIIKRKESIFTPSYSKGDKTIYLKQIAGVQLKLASMLTYGYIQFTVPGGEQSLAGFINPKKNKNSITFGPKGNKAAKQIKDKIEELQKLLDSSNGFSAADEIKKYKELLDQGVLTEEEFNKKKKQLLEL